VCINAWLGGTDRDAILLFLSVVGLSVSKISRKHQPDNIIIGGIYIRFRTSYIVVVREVAQKGTFGHLVLGFCRKIL
jgi:hypothetical protein